jgi:gliding motility-associated lipoprotein GldH
MILKDLIIKTQSKKEIAQKEEKNLKKTKTNLIKKGNLKNSIRKKMRNYLICCMFLFSCINNNHKEYRSFNNNIWNTDSTAVFKYTISDTTIKYDLSLKIRHTIDYEFQNLFLFLEDIKKDTVEIILASKNGKWLGSGISDVREVEYVFDKNRIFSKKGEYKIRVEQAMRYGPKDKIENLEHILDIGLIVSEYHD